MGVERCVRFAFELANRRANHHLTLVHKTNVLTFAGDLWHRTVTEVAPEFPDVSWDYNHVDAACIYLVEHPGRYDVIVTDNLFGDILTDLAGAVSGGIGFAASANLNPDRTGPSLFEPVHGAAHDIAGKGIANPLAAIHSAALMLEHLGDNDAAQRILKALSEQSAGHVGPLRRTNCPRRPWATPSQKGSRECPLPRPRRSGWTASSSTGPTPRSTCSPTPCTTAPACSRGSGPTRPRAASPCSVCGDHIRRLFASAKIFMIDVPFTVEEIIEATREVVRVNGLSDGCYLRPLSTSATGRWG